MSTQIGIEMKTAPLTVMVNEDTQKVGEALSNVLADTFTLYLKTHNFHWNVVGPMFHTLHLMFEEQYKNSGWPAMPLPNESARSVAPPPVRTASSRNLRTCESRSL